MRVPENPHEAIVDMANSCYAEYHEFVALSAFELNRKQAEYYSELHMLQEQFTCLIKELRDDLQRFKESRLRHIA
ncbi:hypothetical protein [Paenibacillus agricola]|uniref:Uncharacterized protein n=1 Tax=Paenibacillus agricola TaxID=2716264 RepID=A0ABX0J0F4_9BACL|nr:hypothetical protein [Paenibacillus agricola]NHN29714.1 hypothetical protein [Paenibacillus agricola]